MDLKMEQKSYMFNPHFTLKAKRFRHSAQGITNPAPGQPLPDNKF